jgi:hypothetical protein
MSSSCGKYRRTAVFFCSADIRVAVHPYGVGLFFYLLRFILPPGIAAADAARAGLSANKRSAVRCSDKH